jgi:DNA-binding winged helix-turn-helix (wHTH) protein
MISWYIIGHMPGDAYLPNNLEQDKIKILLDAGESFHNGGDPARLAELLVNVLLRAVSADGTAILEFDSANNCLSIFKKVGKLSFNIDQIDYNRLACMLKFKPMLVSSSNGFNKMIGRLAVSALVCPCRCDHRDYIFWAERIVEHPSFFNEDLDLFTILVRQGTLALENAILSGRLTGAYLHSPDNANIHREIESNKTIDEHARLASSHGIKEKYLPGVLRKEKLVVPIGDEACFDPDGRVISYRKHQVNLTPAESAFVAILFHNDKQVVKHQDLVSLIQGYQTEKEDAARILRPLVCRLRKKIDRIAKSPDWIQNVRGIGYRIDTQYIK